MTTLEEQRWLAYLYQDHTQEEIRAWCSRLGMFRFFRAYGGHANDGDSLEVAIKYSNQAQLLDTLESLGFKPKVFTQKPVQPEAGATYPASEFKRFPSLVRNTKWVEQPGHCEIFGINVFIWCHESTISISTSGGSYSVNELHVQNAEYIEIKLESLNLALQDPPKDNKHYICPKFYPELYS